jgi:hypothetical protein
VLGDERERLGGAHESRLGVLAGEVHGGGHADADEREAGAVGGADQRRRVAGEESRHVARVGQPFDERRVAHLGADLGVEPALHVERLRPRGGIGRQERRLRMLALEVLDDLRRTDDRQRALAPHRQLLLTRPPHGRQDVHARQIRAASMRNALVVEHPADLLVEVREAELVQGRQSG